MFEAVFGHERPKKILQRMVETGQLPNGLCFHGPQGIGKRLLAQQLSKVLFCDKKTGCDECPHCLKFASGNHPDYLEISPDGADIKVDQVREIADNLHFRPFEAPVRTVVLDRVERFREGAANAFLKSLEEPPEYVYFILIAGDLEALLPTIRSRCQKLGFQSLSPEDKAAILRAKFLKDEAMARRLADISFRQLETENEAWDVFCEDVRRILTFFQLMLDEGHGLDYFNEQVRDKVVFPRFHDHLTAVVRELTMLAAGLKPQEVFEGVAEQMATLAQRCDVSAWRDAWDQIDRLHGLSRLNLNKGLWFNTFSVTALRLAENSESQFKQRLRRAR